MNLRYSEKFLSSQGEGMFVGVPSVFLRTFGCNFRCKAFGLPKGSVVGKHNPDVKALLDNGILDSVQTFEALPLVHTGCDTYASIYPEFKKYMKNESVNEVVSGLLDLTSEKSWILNNSQDIHLILTGGEPLLWQKFWVEMLKDQGMSSLKNLTFETNATQELSDDLHETLEVLSNIKVTWSCSPKLSVSGESWEDAIKPDVLAGYQDVLSSNIYLKFVVENETDMEEVDQAVSEYRNAGVECPVYLMPAGGCIEEYRMNERVVADLALSRGWRFSPRMQLHLYGNAWGT